jgi:hypothetical protein
VRQEAGGNGEKQEVIGQHVHLVDLNIDSVAQEGMTSSAGLIN